MDSPAPEFSENVGSFPVREARRLFQALEARAIPFEFEAPHTELSSFTASRGAAGDSVQVSIYVSPAHVEAFHETYQALFGG